MNKPAKNIYDQLDIIWHSTYLSSQFDVIMIDPSTFKIVSVTLFLQNGWVDFLPIIECYIEGDEMSMECKIMENEEY